MQVANILNKVKGFAVGGADQNATAPTANPFKNAGLGTGQTVGVNPFRPQALPKQDPSSELSEIARRGSAFTADGSAGRPLQGGMHTPAGLAGQQLQVFA